MPVAPPMSASGRCPHIWKCLRILNAGLVAMNLVLALTDQGIGSNIILGFDKSKINEVLEIDERFRPELLITVGYTDEKLEPSYRLPVDEIIEKR